MNVKKLICLVIVAVANGSACDPPPESPKPNIVLFLVDDMGWQDTSVAFHSVRTPFNDHFRTPNMERLAASGIRFTQAYAAAVCSPTRTSLMTGQSPVRHHVTNWTLFPDRDESGETERLTSPRDWRKEGLQPGVPTLPGLLREAGYTTIHCGKAHWGAHGTPGSDPLKLGFDVNIAGHAAGAPGDYHGARNFGNEVVGAYTPPWGVPGLEKYHGSDIHLTDALTKEALSAVEAAVEANRPFFLYMAHYAVHTPIQEHQPFFEHYSGRNYTATSLAIPEVEARYASMVEGVDQSLGAILGKLAELGVGDKTVILFTSDNGGLSAHGRGTTPRGTEADTHNWPLRAGKGSAYEGGTRVPLLVSWVTPDRTSQIQQLLPIEAGTVSHERVISEDLFPTICRVAGATAPTAYFSDVDGFDLTDLIGGRQEKLSERPLLFHYPHVWGPKGQGYEPHSAIREGDWKAIYFYQPRRWELYNLTDDLGEASDLAVSRQQELKQLAALMKTQLERLGAQYPTSKVTGAPEPPAWP